MDVFITFIGLLLFCIKETNGYIHNKGVRDYCLLDKFNPKCKDNEVIIINSALLGRMKNNHCIAGDNAQIGCFADVKSILEKACGGRQTCSLIPSDASLLATRPCRQIFNLYMTVSYSCLEVHKDAPGRCHGKNQDVITSDNGYFTSTLKDDFDKGIPRCPWKLKSTSGRQFNVTIQKFPSGPNNKGSNPPVCHSAAMIKERTKTKNILLCPSDAVNKSVYLSESDEIELTFTNDGSNKDFIFLMHYQAIGCQNPVVPKDTHFRRKGNQATVICNESETSWELNCKENEWQGEEKDCAVGWAFASAMGQDEAPPLGMLLIIVTGIALGVLIGGFLLYLAINAFKRYHGLLPAQQIQNPSYEKPFYNPNKMAYNDRTIQRSSMIYGTNRRSYPNRQMPPPVPPPHADNAQMRPPSEISEANRQSHIYETPLFNSL